MLSVSGGRPWFFAAIPLCCCFHVIVVFLIGVLDLKYCSHTGNIWCPKLQAQNCKPKIASQKLQAHLIIQHLWQAVCYTNFIHLWHRFCVQEKVMPLEETVGGDLETTELVLRCREIRRSCMRSGDSIILMSICDASFFAQLYSMHCCTVWISHLSMFPSSRVFQLSWQQCFVLIISLIES